MKSTKVFLSAMMAMLLLIGGAVLASSGDSGGSSGSSSGGSSGGSSSDDSSSSRSSDDSSSSRSSDDSSSSGFEVEEEHGVLFLKPHGGEDAASLAARAAARALEVEDEAGMEVEVEHGVVFLKPHGGANGVGAAVRDLRLENNVRGRILLQVEKHGEAWFVEPLTRKVVFLGRPADALTAMREFGLGITNADLAKIAVAGDDRGANSGNDSLADRLEGRILLQVEDLGQAWWVNPVTHERHSLGRPDDALKVMRSQGLGITDDNLAKLSAMK